MESRRLEPVESAETQPKTTEIGAEADSVGLATDPAAEKPSRSGTWKTPLLIVMTLLVCVLGGLLLAQRDLATRLEAVDSRLQTAKLDVAQARAELAAEQTRAENLESTMSSIHRLSGVLLEDLTALQTLSAVGLAPTAIDEGDLADPVEATPIELGNVEPGPADVSAGPPSEADVFVESARATQSDDASQSGMVPASEVGVALESMPGVASPSDVPLELVPVVEAADEAFGLPMTGERASSLPIVEDPR